MENSGRSHKQSVAAALHNAYDAHAAGILLHSKAGRALFVKRSETAQDHPGEWCCPGGSIEGGETPEQAAHRETQEETGYPAGDLTRIDEGDGFVTFRANVDEEFSPTLCDEHTEFQWAPLDAPPEPTHPGVVSTLRKLTAKDAALDKREYDTNGWFEVKDNPLSKVGVFKYSESSVVKGGDANKMVNVFLPPEELGSEEAIKSFRLLPWTDDHPGALLGDKEEGLVPAEEKGIQGVIGQDIRFDGGILYGNVKVFSEALARKIASGKRELSCGYRCDFVPEDGVYRGERYQYVQRNVRGNHTALVDHGRRGPDVRVLDSAERFTFALDIGETMDRTKEEAEDSVSEETRKFIGDYAADSFNSLVAELEKKGYSKEYATKIAGKVANEKRANGDAKDTSTSGDTTVADTDLTKEEKEKAAADRKAALDARDSKRVARDARRAKDMTEEEEEAEDAAECAEDAEEEKEDEKDESKDARDRRSARDRRAGARDARKAARDRKAKDAAKDKGMDSAEITALVRRESAEVASKAAMDAAVAARRDAVAAQKLYQRLSPIVGAFDHDEMTHADMAAYGLKKLGQAESKDPVTALDYFLAGRGQAPAAAAQDADSGENFVTKYVNAA